MSIRADLVVCTLVVPLLLGCATKKALSRISSGLVGCAPQAIEIEDNRWHWFSRTWSASCGQRLHYCSASRPGGARCTDAQVEQAAVQAPPASAESAAKYEGRWSHVSLDVCPATVELPAAPENVATVTETSELSQKGLRMNGFGTGGDGPGFFFSGIDYSGAKPPDTGTVVHEAIDALSARVNGRTIRKQRLSGRNGESAVIDSREVGGELLVHVFFEGTCLYTAVVAPRDNFATKDVVRFFKSMRVAAH